MNATNASKKLVNFALTTFVTVKAEMSFTFVKVVIISETDQKKIY